MKHNALQELLIDELRDLYDAENRLVKALPKLAKAATSKELRAGFEEHLEQTRGHVDRLKEIFDSFGEKPTGKKCAGMMGLIQEGEEIMDEDFDAEVMDAALIAAYGCVSTWAELLGESEAGALLEKTLEEEKETDGKLTQLSEKINVEAKASGGEEEESDDETSNKKARGARA